MVNKQLISTIYICRKPIPLLSLVECYKTYHSQWQRIHSLTNFLFHMLIWLMYGSYTFIRNHKFITDAKHNFLSKLFCHITPIIRTKLIFNTTPAIWRHDCVLLCSNLSMMKWSLYFIHLLTKKAFQPTNMVCAMCILLDIQTVRYVKHEHGIFTYVYFIMEMYESYNLHIKAIFPKHILSTLWMHW